MENAWNVRIIWVWGPSLVHSFVIFSEFIYYFYIYKRVSFRPGMSSLCWWGGRQSILFMLHPNEANEFMHCVMMIWLSLSSIMFVIQFERFNFVFLINACQHSGNLNWNFQTANPNNSGLKICHYSSFAELFQTIRLFCSNYLLSPWSVSHSHKLLVEPNKLQTTCPRERVRVCVCSRVTF